MQALSTNISAIENVTTIFRLNDFEEWLTHYNVIDLDYNEIEQYEGDERKFALYRNDSDEGLCE